MQLLHAFFSARGNIVRIDSCTDDSIRISLTVAIRLIGAPVNRYTPNKWTLHWKIPGIGGLVGWGGGGRTGTVLLTWCDSIAYALELLQSFVKPSIWCASNTKLWHMDLRNWYYLCFWTRWLTGLHTYALSYSNDTCKIVTWSHQNFLYDRSTFSKIWIINWFTFSF